MEAAQTAGQTEAPPTFLVPPGFLGQALPILACSFWGTQCSVATGHQA